MRGWVRVFVKNWTRQRQPERIVTEHKLWLHCSSTWMRALVECVDLEVFERSSWANVLYQTWHDCSAPPHSIHWAQQRNHNCCDPRNQIKSNSFVQRSVYDAQIRSRLRSKSHSAVNRFRVQNWNTTHTHTLSPAHGKKELPDKPNSWPHKKCATNKLGMRSGWRCSHKFRSTNENLFIKNNNK